MTIRSHLVLVGAAGVLLVAGGCGDDDAAAATRPTVTVTVGDGTIDVPDEFAGGLVDVELVAEPGEQSHHLVFARLEDGVTYDELDAAGDEAFFGLVSLRGGNGSLAPGDTARLTLDLAAGDYEILDLPDGELAASARTTVTSASDDAPAPDADGTVTLGPGMAFDVPDDFDGTGVWEFANADDELPHEAVLVALEPDATAADVAEWATSFEGPPPGEIVGGFGSLSGGRHGWLDLTVDLDPGDYALVCLLPGPDGAAHAANGMVADFTVRG